MFILFALILPYSPLVLLLCRWQKRRSKTVSSGPLILHVRNITKRKWRCMCSWTLPFSQLSVNSFWKSVEFRCFSHCCNSRHSVPFLCLRPLLLYIEPSSRWVLQAETAAFLLAIAPFPSPNGCFAHLSANYKTLLSCSLLCPPFCWNHPIYIRYLSSKCHFVVLKIVSKTLWAP